MDEHGSGAEGPAERRLLAYLDTLGTDPPEGPAALTARVVSSARWQRALRPYLGTAGGLIGAAGAAMRILIEPRRA
jgi:hypothetical protein